MKKMLNTIEKAIEENYEKVKKQGKILSGIEEVYRQVRFQNPELAAHIKKRMLEIAENEGNLTLDQEELSKESMTCIARHLKAYHRQSVNDEMAAFGEPCADCEYAETCQFDWYAQMEPLLNRTNVTIQLCRSARTK